MLEVNWLRLVGALTVACAILVHPNRAGAAGTDVPVAGPSIVPEATPPAALSPLAPVPVAPPEGVFGSTLWGGRGIHRLVSGFATTRQAIVLSGSSAYHNTSSVFLAGDRNTRASQSIDLAYAPSSGLELSVSYRLMLDNYSGLARRNLEAQGNPTLRVKYGHRVVGPVAMGLQAAATMPTSALGRGLTARATSAEFLGLVSWQAHPRIEVIGNFGYLMDRSDAIFAQDSADVLQRFAYQINRTKNALPYGLGAQGRITLGHAVDLQPFVEITGVLGLDHGANLKNDPFRATGGIKLYPTRSKVLELALGADGALGGRPQRGSPFGGQPRWEMFAHLHAHIGQLFLGYRQAAIVPVSQDGQLAKVFGDPSRDMATFRLEGKVLDADSKRPIFGARVMVGEAEDVLLATDDQSGSFRSWPISAGPGLIRVTARAMGYIDDERLIPRPRADEMAELNFALKADLAKQRLATLRGTFRDARSGKAIAGGKVTIDTLDILATADRSGKFSMRAKPGRYKVTFVASGFSKLERTLTLRPDETLLFNAELKPETTTP